MSISMKVKIFGEIQRHSEFCFLSLSYVLVAGHFLSGMSQLDVGDLRKCAGGCGVVALRGIT